MFLVTRHAPTISDGDRTRDGEGGAANPPGIEVVSKTVIGPHSVTVVKIQNPEHFTGWINDFFKNEGIDAVPEKADRMKDTVAAYLGRGLELFCLRRRIGDGRGNRHRPPPLSFSDRRSLLSPRDILRDIG